jgi:hypothetical protein
MDSPGERMGAALVMRVPPRARGDMPSSTTSHREGQFRIYFTPARQDRQSAAAVHRFAVAATHFCALLSLLTLCKFAGSTTLHCSKARATGAGRAGVCPETPPAAGSGRRFKRQTVVYDGRSTACPSRDSHAGAA